MRLFPVFATLATAVVLHGADTASLLPIETQVTHGFATNNGVRIHYASLGKGPLIVMIHGFPDYWLTWRHQMEALAGTYRVVAIDQRGYNLSDKPAGAENYDMRLLVGDVAAVSHVFKLSGSIAPIPLLGEVNGQVVASPLRMGCHQLANSDQILGLNHSALNYQLVHARAVLPKGAFRVQFYSKENVAENKRW